MQLGLASTDIKSECVCACRVISRLNIIIYMICLHSNTIKQKCWQTPLLKDGYVNCCQSYTRLHPF